MKPTIAAAIAVLLCPAWGAAGADEPALRVYLPREIAVEATALTVAAVAVVRGGDAARVAQAEAVPLGRSPLPRERLVIDRRTILSRLASHGIGADDVRMAGAPAVAVTRKEKVVSAGQIIRCAEALLKKHPPGPAGCEWQLVRRPPDMVLAVAEAPRLVAELGGAAPRGYKAVRVVARVGGRQVGAAALLYRRMHPTRRAVAVREILPGRKIMPEDVKIETVLTPTPQDADWTPPYGMIVSTRIAPGTVLRRGLVRPAARSVAVRRNQTVVMRIAGPGFTISGLALALQDGRIGDAIRVRNTDSKRIVVAKVTANGAVEPVIEEKKP